MIKRYQLKRIVAVIITMSFLLFSSSIAEEAYDFRHSKWGDSRASVEAQEGEPIYSNNVEGTKNIAIVYEKSVTGLDAYLLFFFNDQDQLYRTKYVLLEDHSNGSGYIKDYEKVKDALIKKYGDPGFDEEIWSDDGKKSYYADRKGDALEYGYLSYMTIWSASSSWFGMEMSADNYEVTTNIEFYSHQYSGDEADYSSDF